MSAPNIIPVTNKADKLRFIKSQWNFYKGDNSFVPPIIMDREKLLDEKKNPFYKHSAIQLFLAEKNGHIIGRIAAIINDNHNIIHNDNIGFFGFFECEDNQETANALFHAAEEWLTIKGKSEIRGPVNPSMNDVCGLLVDGFDSPPVILMTYNPKYYEKLVENYGFGKVKDLHAYILDQNTFVSDKMRRTVDIIRQRSQVTIREVDFKNKENFKRDVKILKDIYNAAWQPNWGFVKMTDEEFDFLAADLKQIADPVYTLIAEVKGKVAGFALAIPDINQLRIIVLGVLPEYQKHGVDAVLYQEIGSRGLPRGIQYGEASWILEDNEPMKKALTTTMHGTIYKTYRMYQKTL
jgi:GNAT superfamily N-acetyltransferase